MNLAILRVNGSDRALETLRTTLFIEPYDVWKKGDYLSISKRGKTHLSSGFSISVADAENSGAMFTSIREFLARCKKQGLQFSGTDLKAKLSIGFDVGDSVRYVGVLNFPPSDLLLLAQLGLTLSVSAYPTSDEANAESPLP
jgi:hypothetical protein